MNTLSNRAARSARPTADYIGIRPTVNPLLGEKTQVRASL